MASNDALSAMDVTDFRSVYETEGQYNLTVQIPYLATLAEHYEKFGSEDPTTNWRSILQAHSLYNSCAARHQDTAEQFLQKAVTVQNMYNKAAEIPRMPYKKLQGIQRVHKDALGEIRTKCRETMEALLTVIESYQEEPANLDSHHNYMIEEKIFTDMRTISINCNNDMVDVAHNIVSDSVLLIGVTPPCSFSILAMGSLARGEATPFSDLEFFFLVEENNSITDNYFEHLAMTVYFLIGNLQETNLKYMDLEELEGWFNDEGRSGFKIDGLRTNAGNIPTGNGKTDMKNKYICTVDSLVARYEHILNGEKTEGSSSVTGDDSDMMAYLRLISSYGDQGNALFDKIQARLADICPNEKRVVETIITLLKDMERYDINPLDSSGKGYHLEMKTEVYRYPSLFLLNMKIFLQLQSASTWETIEELKKCGLLSVFSSGFPCYFAVCLLIRLASYLYLDSQYERISLLRTNCGKLNINEQTSKQWHIPQKVLLVYFISMCPSKAALILFFSDKAKNKNTDDPWYSNAGQHGRLLSALSAKLSSTAGYAATNYAECIPERLYSKIPDNTLRFLVIFYFGCDNHEMAYKLITARRTGPLELIENWATSLKWQLTLYLGKWQENKLLEDRMQEVLRQKPLDPDMAALLIKAFLRLKNRGCRIPFDLAVLDIDYPDDPFYLQSRGLLCFLKEEYEESLKFHLGHLSYLDTSMGKESVIYAKSNALGQIAELHQEIGNKEYKSGQKKQAKEQYKASLKRHQESVEMDWILDSTNSHRIAVKLKNLSVCHFQLNNFTQAEELLRKSVKMSKELEGEISMSVVEGYKDLYDLNMIMDQSQVAELYLKKHEELQICLLLRTAMNPELQTYNGLKPTETTSGYLIPCIIHRFTGEMKLDFECC